MGQQAPDTPTQGMKWFKFVVYAQLFPSAEAPHGNGRP